MVGCKQRGEADLERLDIAGHSLFRGQLFLMPSKVDIEVMEHHARAGEASPEGDEKAAVTPAPERKKGVRIRD
jgi:hypothetical protein